MSDPISPRKQAKSTTSAGYRVRAVDLYERKTDFKPDEKYFENGERNDYPVVIMGAILNSPTGIKASQLMAKYIAGRGILGDDVIVNSKKETTVSDLRVEIARDFANQYGTFIHRTLKIDVYRENPDDEPSIRFSTGECKVLPFQKCRIGRPDDNDNLGKVYFDDFEEDAGGQKLWQKKKKEEKKWFYPFSNDANVIKAQIIADFRLYLEKYNEKNKADQKNIEDFTLGDMVRHYRGQVLFENLTPEFVYPIARADSVVNDMDTEFRIGVFSNKQLRNGFLGKLLMMINSTDNEENKNLADDMEKWLGVENSGDIYLLEFEERVENMGELIETIKLEKEFDDDAFENTVVRVRKNILGAFNNAPEALVFAGEGSAMFGNSGEQLREMQLFYQDQTAEERTILEKVLRKLGYNVSIEPLFDIPEGVEEEVLDDQARAQATLRGSLQGVQGILQLQTAVRNQEIAIENAVQILIHVYGYNEEIARAMIGNPQIVTPKTNETT